MADTTSERCERGGTAWNARHGLAHSSADVPDAHRTGYEEQRSAQSDTTQQRPVECCGGWPPEPPVGRVVNGLAHRVDRLTALGNGQVPRVACAAWRILSSNTRNQRPA